MAQFTVYGNTNKNSKKLYPYLMDIQSGLLDELRTTVVVPLATQRIAGKALINKLCPVVEILDEPYVVLTQQLASIDRSLLGNQICDLSSQRLEIINALDLLITGF